MAKDYTFKNTIPLAPLKIVAMESCQEFGKMVDDYIVPFEKTTRKFLKPGKAM